MEKTDDLSLINKKVKLTFTAGYEVTGIVVGKTDNMWAIQLQQKTIRYYNADHIREIEVVE